MRTTVRSPATSARNVSPDQPPSSGVREARSMGSSLPSVDADNSPGHPPVRVERRLVDEAESRHANGPDWDRYADEYQATHGRSEEHTSELQSHLNLVCRLLLEKKKKR